MSVMNEKDSDSVPNIVHNPLEQYVLLAKGAKGSACLELIRQVLEAPGVYVFGELLDMPNVIEVKKILKQLYWFLKLKYTYIFFFLSLRIALMIAILIHYICLHMELTNNTYKTKIK